MSTDVYRMPDDGFEEYYRRRIWEMVPAVYRRRDGEGDGSLEALVEAMAVQAAQLKRSQDRLWENQSVELGDSWVLPYLADLVGTRLVSPLNERGRRVDVAKTVYYRRRAGTPAVLEELVHDIAGHRGRVVENFRRLVRPPHRLDGPLEPRPSRALTDTPPGGVAELRAPQIAPMLDGPFDELHRTPDVRRHRGMLGRYNIPKLAFHLYRVDVVRMVEVTPGESDDDGQTYGTFDPSGRDIQLYAPPGTGDGADPAPCCSVEDPTDPVRRPGRPRFPTDYPAPLRCETLNQAEYRVGPAAFEALTDVTSLDPSEHDDVSEVLTRLADSDARFSSRRRFERVLRGYEGGRLLLSHDDDRRVVASCLVEQCGRASLVGEHPGDRVVDVSMASGSLEARRRAAADLSDLAARPTDPEIDCWIDPEHGRLVADGDVDTVTYGLGIPGRIGAGVFERPAPETRGVDHTVSAGGPIAASDLPDGTTVEIRDSRTYGPVGNKNQVRDLVIQAANGRRPYLEPGGEWTFRGVPGERDNRLVLDGLWVGSDADGRGLVLYGDFETVEIRTCTLDPGAPSGQPAACPLVVKGDVDELLISSSITGPIVTRDGGSLDRLALTDSIVAAEDHTGDAISLADPAGVELGGVTVAGGLDARHLDASNAIVTGAIELTNVQTGCFRYGAALEGVDLPQPYRTTRLRPEARDQLFVSTRFGDAHYFWLSRHAPEALRTGGTDRAEKGAWHHRYASVRRADLEAKIDEYIPFGTIPMFIDQT